MASYLDKTQVNTALTDNTKFDLGHQSITTADFMQLNVSTIHELVPGSKIDVNMETFSRLNPLVVPTFGRAAIRNRAFFVPFRTIFRGWNDFITDSVHIASNGYNGTSGVLSSVPTVDMATLTGAFLSSVGSSSTDNAMIYPLPSTAISYDIIVSGAKYNYTVLGRQSIKILEQLGYKLDWDAKIGNCILSSMPLLALAKIYVDWYFPQSYSNLSSYERLLSYTNYDVDSGPVALNAADIVMLLTICSYVQYDSDLFVSAWDSPNQPNGSNYSSDFKLTNIDTVNSFFTSAAYNYSESGYVTNNAGAASSTNRLGYADAPFISPYATGGATNGVGVTPISEYLLHSLHALTDYMKRHQLAGSRAMDRYLARFGKALPAEKMNRSLYLGASMQDVQIGDIMSTSDTYDSTDETGAQLGTFAGKGISYGNGHFEYDTDEFGYFIIISSIVPASGYYQGIDPQVQRVSKLEFFTPEFDSLGVEALPASALYIPQFSGQMTTGSPYTTIFGFVPRYASYKAPTCSDRLTGNFRLGSLNAPMSGIINAADSWHLMRVFKAADFNSNWTNVIHTPDFISGKGDFSQYKRLFYDIEADAPDNFTIIHNFEIAEYAPMKPLYDEYDFEDKGKKVTLDVNGVKMN